MGSTGRELGLQCAVHNFAQDLSVGDPEIEAIDEKKVKGVCIYGYV